MRKHQKGCGKINITAKRIWELDFARGIALILMVYFHAIYDMKDVFGYNVIYETGVNYIIGKISAVTFIAVAAMSSYLSRNNIKRGAKVLAAALVITAATHLFGPEFGIKFGILHFLGTCMLLFPLLDRLSLKMLIFIGILVIFTGILLQRINAPFNFLFILGLAGTGFASADYYPLLPWGGVFLLGMALGRTIYGRGLRILKRDLPDNPINALGRHTLLVYLLHQPIILAALWLVKFVTNSS